MPEMFRILKFSCIKSKQEQETNFTVYYKMLCLSSVTIFPACPQSYQKFTNSFWKRKMKRKSRNNGTVETSFLLNEIKIFVFIRKRESIFTECDRLVRSENAGIEFRHHEDDDGRRIQSIFKCWGRILVFCTGSKAEEIAIALENLKQRPNRRLKNKKSRKSLGIE